MSAPPGPRDEEAGTDVAYFMIRIQRTGSDPRAISGAIERLGTGERRTFQDGEELLRLVSSWPGASSKMQAGQGAGNLAEPESS